MLKLETERFSKMLVSYINKWYHNPKKKKNLHCHENIKSHIGENCVRCSKLKKKLKYSLRVK